MSKNIRAKLEALLQPYDHLPLECDGFIRVASYVLSLNGILHQTMGGYVQTPETVVSPHFWIEAKGWIVDYRLRMWAGPDMPHGVFVPPDNIVYYGEIVPMLCGKMMFDILTTTTVIDSPIGEPYTRPTRRQP